MYLPFGAKTYTLQSSISSTDTSITLSSFLEPVTDVPYTMALLNTDIVYATIQPKTNSSEFISFTGITQNANGTATLTGVTRGLAKKYPFTADSAYRLPHAGQSQFIISDVPQVFVEYAALENNNSFTGLNAFTQTLTVPTPINNTDAANKEWVLTVVNGGPITVSQLIIAGTAGETVAAGTPVYFKAADARWWKSAGATAATLNNVQLGIAQGAGTAGNAIANGVLLRGVDTNQSGGVAGSIGYVSNTSTISTSAGTVEKAVGNFITASTFAFDPIYYYTPTASTKAALAGGGSFGTPSSTNKFLTQDYATATPSTVMRVYTANDTWTKPTGLVAVEVIAIGGGGGGGEGRSGNVTATGGCGGGGGSIVTKILRASDLSASETVTVATGGAGGTAAGPGNGNPGGSSSFGTKVIAYGGAGGGGAAGGNGSGGGTGGAGTNPSGSDVLGGIPANVVNADGISGQGAGGAATNATSPGAKNAEFGGASGGGASSNASSNSTGGGSSLFGGSGGGAGGAYGGAERTAGAGGAYGNYSGTGGTAGTTSATPTAGGAGTSRSGYGCGDGGGGGGANSAGGTAGAGGAGGAPGGGAGGGGGSSGVLAGGSGGAGGRGEIRVIEYYA